MNVQLTAAVAAAAAGHPGSSLPFLPTAAELDNTVSGLTCLVMFAGSLNP
jgi:hypothetical protein